MGLLTVPRFRGAEMLDDPTLDASVRSSAMADLARSNALFGGTQIVLDALADILFSLPRRPVLLDVGTGTGDIPQAVRRLASDNGVRLTTIGCDASEVVLKSGAHCLDCAVRTDARRLPFADRSVDVVTCSQVLHHFFDGDVGTLIAELHRVTRGWVIVADLQRSRLAAGAFWFASMSLGFHPVTRVDGMTSVLRGFTRAELGSIVRDATGETPRIRRGRFWRLSAVWRRSDAPPSAR